MNSEVKERKVLIEQIRRRGLLWAVRKRNIPGIKKAQEKLWEEVAGLHRSSVTEIKTKWQNLRQAFARQLKKVPITDGNKYQYDPQLLQTDWPHYQDMQFLVDPTMLPPSKTIKIKKESLSARKVTKRRHLNESSNNGDSPDDQENVDVPMEQIKRRRIAENTDDHLQKWK